MNKFINVEYILPIVRFFFINLISILKKKKNQLLHELWITLYTKKKIPSHQKLFHQIIENFFRPPR